MTRFSGQALPARSRIAVVANDAIGNFVVVTPLVQMLRAFRPEGKIDYFGGTRTKELQEAFRLVDSACSLWGVPQREAVQAALNKSGSDPYDLVVNVESSAASRFLTSLLAGEDALVCGPCCGSGGRGDLPFADDARGDLWRDRCWQAPDITDRYPFLQSGFIAEIFCRLCYLEGPIPRYQVPSKEPAAPVPEMLVAASASLSDKLWNWDGWGAALGWARDKGLTVGLLGAKPASQKSNWTGSDDEDRMVEAGLATDLRGIFTLPEVAGALARARIVLTLDNGILHMAAAMGTPTIGLYRHGIPRLWAPPVQNLDVIEAEQDETVTMIPSTLVLEALNRAI